MFTCAAAAKERRRQTTYKKALIGLAIASVLLATIALQVTAEVEWVAPKNTTVGIYVTLEAIPRSVSVKIKNEGPATVTVRVKYYDETTKILVTKKTSLTMGNTLSLVGRVKWIKIENTDENQDAKGTRTITDEETSRELAIPAGKVALVLDVGGRGDLSFNDMASLGLERATGEFGLEVLEVHSTSAADYLPNLQNLARAGDFDLIIAVGFLLGDALATASAEFPDQKFAIIDVDWITGPNIMNIVFRENEASALIGALAAMAAADHGYAAASVVFGMEIPVLYQFEAGYRFGIDWGLKKYTELMGTEPNVAMLYNYIGTFSDIALGKAASEAMLAQGAVGIYNVAGPVGIGNHAAVAEYHAATGMDYGPPYYFGSDSCEDWRGDGMHALASGMKRVNVGTYTAVKAVADGTFVSGVTSLGLAEGGVGISRYQDMIEWLEFGVDAGQIEDTQEARNFVIANWTANRQTVAQWIWAAIDELEAGILDGTIAIPTANSDDEINAIREQYPLE